MSSPQYYIYTDASFSHLQSFGVSGFLIFDSQDSHEKSQPAKPGLRTHFFKESNNIRAEIVGALYALQIFIEERKKDGQKFESFETHLYSDCQTLTNLLERREKLKATNYISARTKTELINTDLYKKFFAVYDELKPSIHWVKGHSKKATKTLTEKNFELVDKQVRKELRATVDRVV